MLLALSAAWAQEAAGLDAEHLDVAERRVARAYRDAAPAVVNVTTQVLESSFFYGPTPREGAGSGFLVDEAGRIVTNYHVIENARRIEITFSDGSAAAARVVGADPRNDLALLRAQSVPDTLTPLRLGSSAQLTVGQRTLAIGNPFGEFGGTLTTGVVSALDRRLEGPEGIDIAGMIQTDAAVNRGNSGGPLLDSEGRVIGVNTAIVSPSGTSAGLSFAVPVDTPTRVLPDLIEHGRYRHPSLGVRAAHTLTPALARALEAPVAQGLLLVQLHEGGPLARAGARGATRRAVCGNRRYYLAGDLLHAVDGRAVRSWNDLQVHLDANYRVGDTVTVTAYRGDRRLEWEVQLAEGR